MLVELPSIAILLLSLGGLVWSADRAVTSARALSARLGVPPLVIGLTVTSIGTSLPEVGTNVAAALSGLRGLDASGIAVGNIVGSNLGQITLLLGLSGLAARLTLPTHSLRRDGAAVLGALGVMFLVSVDGVVRPPEGIALVALYAGYLAFVVRQEVARARAEDLPRAVRTGGSTLGHTVIVLVGLAAVVGCADLLVGRAVYLGRTLGADEITLGLLVGLGSSLPELTVSLRALRSDDSGLSLGNLLGSNITDPLLSFGVGAAIHPVSVPHRVLAFDFPCWLVATATALLLLSNDRNLDRRESGVLLLLFGLYLYLRLGGAA